MPKTLLTCLSGPLIPFTWNVLDDGLHWCASALVNEARKTMFIRDLKSIPPTQHALFQHAKRPQLTAQHLSGTMHLLNHRIFQTLVSGDGNGILETNHGYHIGQIWLMSAKHVPFYFGVTVWCFVGESVSISRAGLHCSSTLWQCEGGCKNNETETWSC